MGLSWVQTQRLQVEKTERIRMQNNVLVLTDSIEHYRTESGKNAASRNVFQLKASELEQYNAQLNKTIRDLRIKNNRLESAATTSTKTIIELKARIQDTIIMREHYFAPIVHDTVKSFKWRDTWVSVDGLIHNDSVNCYVKSIDTLHQIVHRVPRRFLFIRWGTKSIRQEVVSSNPHTHIVYTEFIELKKRKR